MAGTDTKLYPPYTEGILPAFSDASRVKIPFSMNRAVSPDDFTAMHLIVKTVQNSTILGNVHSNNYSIAGKSKYVVFDLSTLATEKKIKPQQYYKFQIAYVQNGTVGYYSECATIKYTTTPTVSIQNLTKGKINSHMYDYTGVYSQTGDITEKLYSSRFILTDKNGYIIEDSGDILHNTSNDVYVGEQYETYSIKYDLQENSTYYLEFIAKSINGLQVSSGRYALTTGIAFQFSKDYSLDAILNKDDGYVQLNLQSNEPGVTLSGTFAISRAASDENYLWRQIHTIRLQDKDKIDNLWRDFTIKQGVNYKYAIQLINNIGLYSDRLEAGSLKILNYADNYEEVPYVDFEDAFLYDGKRQLKIRYNPKISSYKIDVLEQKTDTIGAKYPFIFRNGNVYYHEFPIAGLISYQMDDNQLFLTDDELGLENATAFAPIDRDMGTTNMSGNAYGDAKVQIRTSALVDYNFYAERIFKNEVLEWLNNGELKLFRSPSEGNFIVRLMNTSLTPNDTVSRLIHNFSSTAYEMEEFRFDNIFNKGFFNSPKFDVNNIQSDNLAEADSIIHQQRVVLLAGVDEDLARTIRKWYYNYNNIGPSMLFDQYQRLRIENLPSFSARGLTFYTTKNNFYELTALQADVDVLRQDMFNEDGTTAVTYLNCPADDYWMAVDNVTHFKITDMKPGTVLKLRRSSSEDLVVTIGVTGTYEADFLDDPITGLNIRFDTDIMFSTGIMYLSENTTAIISDTDIYSGIAIEEVPVRQWVGNANNCDINIIGYDYASKNNYTPMEEGDIYFPDNYYYKIGDEYELATEDVQRDGVEYYKKIEYNSAWQIENIKDKLINFVQLKFYSKKQIPYWEYNGKTYSMPDMGDVNTDDYLIDITKNTDIYEYVKQEDLELVGKNTGYIRDAYTYRMPQNDISEKNAVYIDGSKFYVFEDRDLILKNINSIKNLTIGENVILEASYLLFDTSFNIENSDPLVQSYKYLYEQAAKDYEVRPSEFTRKRKYGAYNNYIMQLSAALTEGGYLE